MRATSTTRTHPLHQFSGRIHEVLDGLANTSHLGMEVPELAEAVVELHRAEARLAGMKLRLLAAAHRADVGEATASTTAGWLAGATTMDRRRARREVKLAEELVGRRFRTGEALAAGEVSVEQAEVVIGAVAALPASAGADGRDRAEQHLLEEAAKFGPRELRILGKRIFEVVDPDAADAHLAQQLAREEAEAQRKTFLTLWDDGKGTTWGRFAIPTLAGDMLTTALNALASPRRPGAYGRTDETGAALPGSALLGQALVEYVERYPTDRLPHTGGLNTTLLVDIPHETLMGGLKAADLLSGHRLSPGEARRLACEAGLLPRVLGGRSQVLDYGRERRLHSTGQRKVIHARDKTCCAEGCDVPANWCHVHHRVPWGKGGRTSVADGMSLCPRHHRRAHDSTFEMADAGGRVRFTRIRQ